jgi:hypothetical protein
MLLAATLLAKLSMVVSMLGAVALLHSMTLTAMAHQTALMSVPEITTKFMLEFVDAMSQRWIVTAMAHQTALIDVQMIMARLGQVSVDVVQTTQILTWIAHQIATTNALGFRIVGLQIHIMQL